MKFPRVFAVVLIQLAVPALVYFAICLSLRHAISADDLKWFAPNYAFMAGAHIVVVLAAGAFPALRRSMLSNLTAASISLTVFAAWLVSQVPARESGLAWILYPPFVALALALLYVVRRLRAKASKNAGAAGR